MNSKEKEDYVKVVRCKDCAWAIRRRHWYGYDLVDCTRFPEGHPNRAHRIEAFCSYGVKRFR